MNNDNIVVTIERQEGGRSTLALVWAGPSGGRIVVQAIVEAEVLAWAPDADDLRELELSDCPEQVKKRLKAWALTGRLNDHFLRPMLAELAVRLGEWKA